MLFALSGYEEIEFRWSRIGGGITRYFLIIQMGFGSTGGLLDIATSEREWLICRGPVSLNETLNRYYASTLFFYNHFNCTLKSFLMKYYNLYVALRPLQPLRKGLTC